ncbi:MAG: hypothetical protein A2V77_04835 [Anaeromyxobacter sp. RBG_16_69_14]|nr:MAG: hypothetical protein A2V77_04835 [Anaeromyxobacter sp. RBG_16_69_14]
MPAYLRERGRSGGCRFTCIRRYQDDGPPLSPGQREPELLESAAGTVRTAHRALACKAAGFGVICFMHFSRNTGNPSKAIRWLSSSGTAD